MTVQILKQLPSGRLVNLMRPDPAALDSEFWGIDVPVSLARQARFGGAAGCPASLRPWSVLDHVVVGADELQPMGRRFQLLFLMHDVHEAVISDIPTPTAAAVAAHVGRICGKAELGKVDPERATRSAITMLKQEWDAAIYASAGVPLPTPEEAKVIHMHDLRMMMTERRDLMGSRHTRWPGLEHIKPLPRCLLDRRGQWPAPNVRVDAFLTRLDNWAPQARRRSIDPIADYAETARSLGYSAQGATS